MPHRSGITNSAFESTFGRRKVDGLMGRWGPWGKVISQLQVDRDGGKQKKLLMHALVEVSGEVASPHSHPWISLGLHD